MRDTAYLRLKLVTWLVIVILAAADHARGDASTLDRSIAALEAEARQIISGSEEVRLTMARPHPSVAALTTGDVPDVLERIDRPFTGNAYADTYIRWHLLEVVDRALGEAFERFRTTGEHEANPVIARTLIDLVQDMPPQPVYDWRNPVAESPPDLVERRDRLKDAIEGYAVEVGFPPFNRRYRGEAALPHLGRQKREELRRLIDEQDAVEKRITRRRDPQLERQNELARFMSRIVRSYRGDLMYAIVRSGDGPTLRRAATEIARLAGDRQRAGYDLLAYMYLASFDGSLSLYDEPTLEAVRRELESAARKHDRYEQVMDGEKPAPSYVVPGVRNFADASFHLRQLLRSPDQIRQLLGGSHRPASPPPAGSAAPVTPEALTIENVRGAINRAVAFLADPPEDEGKAFEVLRPHYGVRDDQTMWAIERGRGTAGDPVRRQALRHEIGNHAAIVWALLSAGETYQSPELLKRINWIFAADTPYTYDRAMRVLMASQLSTARWGDYLRRDVDWLLASMTEKGGFDGEFYGERSDGWGDHANAQYAVLALTAAADVGVDVPGKAWDLIDRHWRLSQDDRDDASAGWAIDVLGLAAKAREEEQKQAGGRRAGSGGDRSFNRRVTAPMTAGGVATLVSTERLRGESDGGFSRELQRGLAWLDANFRVDAGGNDLDWYFHMWTLQRVGQASGHARFNGVDWFRQVTAAVINRQNPRGYWEDEGGRLGIGPSTAFALLYLGAALDPVAISKLRYDGQWNDRPTDLWNFVDYASDLYEHRTTWRIVDADQPVHELLESPLLLMSVGDRLTLDDATVAALREYVLAGGLLLINPDRPTAEIGRSVRDFANALLPGLTLEAIDPEDPLYRLHREVRPSVRMEAVSNGIRPLVIVFSRDIGEDLQDNQRITSDSFALLSNLYLSAVGKNPRRTRLQTDYLPAVSTPAKATVRGARIRYEGGFDPEPAALTQLGRALLADHGVKLDVDALSADELDRDVKIAFVTTTGSGGLSDADAAALRGWLEQGGTLWLDAAGGSTAATDAAFAMLRQIAPDTPPLPMRPDHPVLTGEGLPRNALDNTLVRYRRYALQRMTPTNRPRLQTIDVAGRPAIIFSPEDLTAAWAGLDHWGVFGYDVESARRLGINGVLNAIGD